MDSGISTVRNLLYIVLVLVVLSLLTSIYLGTQLSRNSDELARLSLLMQKQLMTTAVEQSQQLQEKMERLNQQADGIDAKMEAAQNRFEDKMKRDLPPLMERTMDNYVRTRMPRVEREAMKQLPPR